MDVFDCFDERGEMIWLQFKGINEILKGSFRVINFEADDSKQMIDRIRTIIGFYIFFANLFSFIETFWLHIDRGQKKDSTLYNICLFMWKFSIDTVGLILKKDMIQHVDGFLHKCTNFWVGMGQFDLSINGWLLIVKLLIIFYSFWIFLANEVQFCYFD